MIFKLKLSIFNSKDKSYYDKLSGASKQTLIFQGGVMSEAEAIELENNEMFNTLLKIRVWDDLAKDSELNLSSNINALFEKYKKMLADLS
jgi:predicted HD phosphohydrolase